MTPRRATVEIFISKKRGEEDDDDVGFCGVGGEAAEEVDAAEAGRDGGVAGGGVLHVVDVVAAGSLCLSDRIKAKVSIMVSWANLR